MGEPSKRFLDYQWFLASGMKASRQRVLFIAYEGNSMNPTLREPELMEVSPYQGQPIRRGDVIYFTHQGELPAVVHRVIGITGQGIITRGDYNPVSDDWILSEQQVIGRVTAAWRGSQRRVIRGGWLGLQQDQVLRVLRWLTQSFSRQLSPVYQHLCAAGFLSHLLPERLRPRIIHFRAGDREQLFLFWGRILIGRYVETEGWIIQRPFRLVVNEQILKNITIQAAQ